MSNDCQLLVIVGPQCSEMDKALVRLAEWMGLSTQIERVSDSSSFLKEFPKRTHSEEACIALSADTLAMLSTAETVHDFNRRFPQRFMRCLVYGFRSSPSHNGALKSLATPNICGLESLPEGQRRFRFTTRRETWLGPLCGLDFPEQSGGPCDVFEVTASVSAQCTPILLVEDRPVFIRSSSVSGKDIFLWATTRIADVEAQLPQGAALEGLYHWLLPAIIFLKASFGSRCWYNPHIRARLIIDDPLLHSQYGFLRYDVLLKSMDRVPYGTSIAFIPWNYRRSREKVVKLFRGNAERLSLCIHGCDHTNHEFDRNDENALIQKANLALHRMNQHHQCNGVSHEKIMVFPQGQFSIPAIAALRKSGFLAVVNSSCYPAQGGVALALGDLLLPAVCQFNGFPIFIRRYPTRIIDIAVDLFLGKAGFVVEHHEFVRNGYEQWEGFASQMNGLDERLAWPALIDTIMETCLQKMGGDDHMDVRFFTPVFRWRNPSNRPVHVRFSRFDPDLSLIKEMRVDGQIIPFQIQEPFIHIERIVSPRSTTTVETVDRTMPPVLPIKTTFRELVGVGSRRFLAEFRDNTLVRYPLLLGYAKSAVNFVKLTGNSR